MGDLRFWSRGNWYPLPLAGGLLLLAMLAAGRPGAGQDDGSRRTGFQSAAIAVKGATLHVAPGEVIESGNLVIRDGRIVAVGTDVEIPVDAHVIDAEGLVAYAGFIDAASEALLDRSKAAPPEAGREPDFRRDVLAATPPDNRRGLTPEFEARSALKLEEAVLSSRRGGGMTAVHVLPLRPVAPGQGCCVSLSGLPPRESLLCESVGCVFQLTPPPSDGQSVTQSYPVTIMGATAHLRQAFLDARHAQQQQRLYEAHVDGVPRPAADPVLDVLNDVLQKDRRPLFVADSRDEIDRALAFAAEHEIVPVLVGGREAAQRIDRIKDAGADVILRIDLGDRPEVEETKPSEKLEPEVKPPVRFQQDVQARWDERAATASQLDEAGIPFALSTHGLDKPEEWLKPIRLLIKHGLSADAALAALTRNAADIIGCGEELGTLEQGKLGHVVLMTGPLEDERSKVRHVVVDGRAFEFNKDAKPVEPEATPSETLQLSGTWKVSIDAGEMQTTNGVLELTQTDARLNGTFSSEQGNGRLTSGKVSGADVEFVVAIGAGDREIALTFKGTHSRDEESGEESLQGSLKSPFGAPTEWSAVRSKLESTADDNPVQLSIDPSDDEPDDKKSKTVAANDLPTELESDREGPARSTGGNLLLQNATVITVAGPVLQETDVLILDGRIAEIGVDLQTEEEVTTIDVAGWYVMPGLIDTHSHIMIEGGVNEFSQSIVPEVRIKDVVRSNDASEYRALSGGLTTARLLHGSANVIGGQDAIVKLKYGAPVDEHILWDAPQGVKFALGENVKARTDRFPNTRMGVEATLKRAFFEALDYRRQWQEYDRLQERGGRRARRTLEPRRDLRLEALAGILDQEVFIHCHCYRADEILMLLRTADELGIHIQSLQHVLEGYKIAPEILAHGASCSTFSDWWAYKIEAFDATPFNTTLLCKAGVNIVVKSDDAELIRHMNLEAAKSLRYGNMPEEDAFRMVTLNSARELNLDDRIGSLEVGKDGDIAVFNGHPFSPFSRCELTIIEGDIWFERAARPTAMSEASQERSATPPQLTLAPTAVRERRLELPPGDTGTYALTGGRIHPVDADVIEQGTVIIADGKFVAVGKDVEITEGAAVIDVTGFELYPGLIDSGTTVGINEIRQVGVTQDFAESGTMQPDVRAGTAVNVDSELIPVARAGGVTTAFLRPAGMTVSGQYSLMQTSGWTSEEMVLDYEAGLSLDWPQDEKRVAALKELLKEARLYDAIRSQPDGERPDVIQDPRYEALRPYLHGEKRVFIEADSRKAIAEALLFAEEEKLKIVITGGTDAWKLADELKTRDVPVIVGPTMRSPTDGWDPFDAPYTNPARLHEAGVLFCIRSDNASNSRNVSFEAGIAVAYGLPEEEALKAITLNAARVLGVEESLGSITTGKTANLIITDGSPLQHTTQIKGVFVAGRPHAPESKQTRLYERYLQRLEPAQ